MIKSLLFDTISAGSRESRQFQPDGNALSNYRDGNNAFVDYYYVAMLIDWGQQTATSYSMTKFFH